MYTRVVFGYTTYEIEQIKSLFVVFRSIVIYIVHTHQISENYSRAYMCARMLSCIYNDLKYKQTIGDLISKIFTIADIVLILLIVWFLNRETTVLNNDFMIIIIKNPCEMAWIV